MLMISRTKKIKRSIHFLVRILILTHRVPMTQHQIKLAKTLTFMGGIPFLIAVILKSLDLNCPILSIDDFTLRYGAVIISFICGIHWGLQITHDIPIRGSLLLTSNLICLIAWATILMDAKYWHYLIQISCFFLLLTVDRKLYGLGIFNQWFYQLRKTITTIVSLSLAVIALLD